MDVMDVMVSQVRYDGGTIAIGVGIDVMSGDRVTFGGDWRPMMALADAVELEGEVLAEVPDWAILRRARA